MILGVSPASTAHHTVAVFYVIPSDIGFEPKVLARLVKATHNDEAVLQLFRAGRDDGEKAELLEMLVMMDSDTAWDVIDATLENGQ
jgi:hypothetical protein